MKRRNHMVAACAAGTAAAVLLSGCGSSGKSSPKTSASSSAGGASSVGASSAAGPSSAPAAASGNHKLAFIPGVIGDPFYVTMQCAASAEAKKLGYTLQTQGPTQFEANLQIPIVNSVAASKPAGILVAPTDVTALHAPLQAAVAAGIKVTLVDTTLTDPALAVSQVASDNVGGGGEAFKAIQQLHPNGGKILVIAVAPGVSTNDLRIQGFQNAAKKYSKFQYLGVQYDKDQATTATQLVTSALAKNPDIVGIFATSTYSVDGAATGLRQAGKQKSVSLVGFDAEPAQIKELKQGTVQALVAQQPGDIGKQGVDQTVNALTGKATTNKIQTGFAIINKSNVDTTGAKYAYQSSCSG